MKLYVFFFLVCFVKNVYGFPQMIRHGYTSCNTCHASSRGGGLMTDYGRALSKELLSSWSFENEEYGHYGAIDHEKVPKWFKMGGDFRALQVHSKDDVATIGRFITMQEQVEVAANYKNNWVSITAASDTLVESRPWYIPGFYVLGQVTPELSVRAGNFTPRFGINTPEHIFSTRGVLGFGIQSERPAVEVTYITPKWDASVTLTDGKLKSEKEARGFYSQVNYSFGTKDRVGLSLEKKVLDDRAISLGAHALVGLSEKLYIMTDTVIRKRDSVATGSETGFFHFLQVGFELEKGLHLIALEDIKKSDLNVSNTTQTTYGIGITFFPRPHLEFQGVWAKRTNLARSSNAGDYAWFLMHYYL